MSDLKKILKEEYDKKKLNITPKLLMEMIEQVMLAEATMTRSDLLKRGNDSKLRTMIKDGNKIKLKDGSFVKIENDQSAQDYITALVAGKPTSKLHFNTEDGKTIKLSQIQKTGTVFSTSGGKKGPGGNVSEKFEGNIIIALGGGSIPKGLSHIDKTQFPDYQKAADKLVTNLKLTPGIYFKPGNGTVTELYRDFNTSNRPPNSTPKTDIANDAKTDRISVKKKGGGFLSSEANETTAIIAAVLGFKSKKELQNGTPAAKLINKLKVKLSKEAWNNLKTSEQRRQLGYDALELIYNFVAQFTNQSFEKYQTAVCLEAMTGNNRFEDELSRANKLLFWDISGNGMYEDLEKWVTANAKNFKFDIRWRGSGRSAGYRIDDKMSEEFAKKLNKLYGIKFEEGRVDEREALKNALTQAALAAMITGGPTPDLEQPPPERPAIEFTVGDEQEQPEKDFNLEDYLIGFMSELVSELEGKIYYEGDEPEKET